MARMNPDPRVEEMMRCTLDMFGVSSCLFYWTDDSGSGMSDVTVGGTAHPAFHLYLDGMYRLDPLNVPTMTRAKSEVALLTDCRRSGALAEGSAFARYMEEIQLRDVMELLFWQRGVPVAGISLRETHADAQLLPQRRVAAPAMHRFLQFTLADHPRVREALLRQTMRDKYQLSAREIEVANLVRHGATNRDITEELEISIATVKTHMTRIFEKLGVENRASLVAILAGA